MLVDDALPSSIYIEIHCMLALLRCNACMQHNLLLSQKIVANEKNEEGANEGSKLELQ